MKRLLLLACTFISFATISQAQITKGSVLLGGNLGFGKGKTESGSTENKGSSFYFNPAAGLAIKDNWVVGINAGISQERSKVSNSTNKYESDGFSGGLFVRRYSSLGKNFYLYGNGGISFNNLNREEYYNTDYDRNIKTTGVSLSIAPGVAYAVSKRFHLEAYLNDLVSFNYSKTETETNSLNGSSKDENRSFGFGTNFNPSSSISIGFRLVIGK